MTADDNGISPVRPVRRNAADGAAFSTFSHSSDVPCRCRRCYGVGWVLAVKYPAVMAVLDVGPPLGNMEIIGNFGSLVSAEAVMKSPAVLSKLCRDTARDYRDCIEKDPADAEDWRADAETLDREADLWARSGVQPTMYHVAEPCACGAPESVAGDGRVACSTCREKEPKS